MKKFKCFIPKEDIVKNPELIKYLSNSSNEDDIIDIILEVPDVIKFIPDEMLTERMKMYALRKKPSLARFLNRNNSKKENCFDVFND